MGGWGGGGGGESGYFLELHIVWYQKISIPTPRKVMGNSEGRGVSNAKILKGKYEGKLEILGGRERGVPTKIPSLWEVWILSGTTQCRQVLCNANYI